MTRGLRPLERTREIIGLSDDLIGDFRRVRDEFCRLNREPFVGELLQVKPHAIRHAMVAT